MSDPISNYESTFSDVCVDVYASPELGHLGGGQLVLKFSN